jgi:hypothetical protein
LPLFLLSISSFAQLQKGNKILGGTLNYSTSKSTSDDMGVAGGQSGKTSSYINNAILGVFVSDRTVLGLNFEINSYSNESTSLGQEFRYGFNQFGFGPFLRRYFPVKEWVAFYGQAQLGYGFGKIKQNYSSTPNQNSERSTNTFNLSATLGLAFFPTNWMSVDLAMNPLSFAHSVNKDEIGSGYPDQKTNTFNFNLSSQAFQIGAHFFLNKK